MNKETMIQQTARAYDLIQKLYFEVSYLVKEVEGLLAEEEESFIIGRPRGYQITWRSSSGLESVNVKLWLMRKFSVFFVPTDRTRKKGSTNTKFTEDLKLIYLRFTLDENDLREPFITVGVLHSFDVKAAETKKFEQIMIHLEYNENQVVIKNKSLSFDDKHLSFKGDIFKVNLFDINSSSDIEEKIIKPVLALYRR